MERNDALAASEVVDFANALENLDDDVALLREVVDMFVGLAPSQLDDLAARIGERDVQAVMISAHGMKGAAASIGAVAFAATALRLELLGKEGSLDGAEALLADLRREFDRLRATLDATDWDSLATG